MKETVYQVITDRVIALLEQGTIPWQKPWGARDENGQPVFAQNLISRKPYRGVNAFVPPALGFESPFWLTFKQAKELGGNVRKGEHGCPIVFWKILDVDSGAAVQADSSRSESAAAKIDHIPFLQYYTGFNLAQCENIPPAKIPALTGIQGYYEPIAEAERIVEKMPKRPEIEHCGERACYSPAFDRVCMPKPATFRSPADYYSVLFHELTHATGHESRLNRKGVSLPAGRQGGGDGEWSAFGSTPYAKEELVAEMGAAFLCAHAGIVERTLNNSAAYVASWLERLRNDCKLVVLAAAQAQKAADFILGVKFDAEGGAQ